MHKNDTASNSPISILLNIESGLLKLSILQGNDMFALSFLSKLITSFFCIFSAPAEIPQTLF